MLIHPTHSSRVLIEQSDLTAEPPHPLLDGVLDQLREVARWAREYLCRPHPDLGRKGSVCPYVQGSLDRGTFYLGMHRGKVVTTEELAETMLVYRDWFRELPPTDGPGAQFKTILVILPEVPPGAANDIVDATQERLKPMFVADGLMIGEFHDGPPNKGGLWNPDFRPLHSAVPLLAIRHMVSSDFPFLGYDPDFTAMYLRLFGTSVPPNLREQVAEAAKRYGLTPPAPAVPAQAGPKDDQTGPLPAPPSTNEATQR